MRDNQIQFVMAMTIAAEPPGSGCRPYRKPVSNSFIEVPSATRCRRGDFRIEQLVKFLGYLVRPEICAKLGRQTYVFFASKNRV